MIALILGVSISIGCYGKSNERNLGIIPIGGLPKALDRFVSTDCGSDKHFSDCSAVDAEGKKYAFFDGALVRVSARAGQGKELVRLPLGIRFGEDIKQASAKVERQLGIKLVSAVGEKGIIVYTSGFVIKSKGQWLYSIELISDDKNRLVEIVERADVP
jgi:hypothetical protein